MAVLPLNSARISLGQKLMMSQRQLTATQQSLLDVQMQLSSGKRLNNVSDDPVAGTVVMQLRKTLADRSAYMNNLQNVQTNLGQVDTTLSTATDLLRQAQQIASANVGSIVSSDERAAAATVVDNLYNQMLSLANQQFQGVYLFGGDRSTSAPYSSELGGVRFVGSENTLGNKVDESASLDFMVKAGDIFGSLSARVTGSADLTPSLTADTRLSDLGGANGDGVRPGSIVLSDGTTSATIDLSGAQTVGDVINAINAAGVGGIVASAGGTGLTLASTAGDNITVTESGGTTAADLGILQKTPAGAGVNLTGQSVQPKVTLLTRLADLKNGAGIDLASGFTLSNGAKSATIDLTGATTVEDLINRVSAAGVGAVAKVNASGTGIDIYNSVQGIAMTIGENGGTTATDLGIRSFGPDTPLSELNDGQGVRTVSGNDLQITQADGSQFQVDLSSAKTVQDVIDAINAASPGGVTASFATTGNGIILSDASVGAGSLMVEGTNASLAVKDLGLDVAASGGTVTGRDSNGVMASGVFADLAALRNAMLHDDSAGITAAGGKLQDDLSQVVRVRGQVGAMVKEAEDRQSRMEDQNVATQALISQLQDTDYNEAITRFQTLQTALQAQLQTTGKMLSQSLLDFLQ